MFSNVFHNSKTKLILSKNADNQRAKCDKYKDENRIAPATKKKVAFRKLF